MSNPRWNQEGCPTSVLDTVPSPTGFAAGKAQPQAQPQAQGQAPGVPLGEGAFVNKVLQLAGPMAQHGRVPALEHYEELFRIEPNDSWFDPARNPNNPTQFEIASVSAEPGRWIFVFDYSVRPFGFSGVAPNDVVPLPEGNMSGSFGYVLRIGGRAAGVLNYRLNPVSSLLRKKQFQFNERGRKRLDELTEDDFARSRAQSFASAAGYGGEVHPQEPGRFGARNVPFMLSIGDDMVMTMTGVIFNRVTTPIAFVEGRISGYITSAIVGTKLLRDLQGTLR